MPCQCHLPVSYFLMKTALQIFIILYASYAWDTCLFRISFANYAIQIVRYDIIYMSIMPNFIEKFADSPYPHTPYRYLPMFHLIFIVMYKYLC